MSIQTSPEDTHPGRPSGFFGSRAVPRLSMDNETASAQIEWRPFLGSSAAYRVMVEEPPACRAGPPKWPSSRPD